MSRTDLPSEKASNFQARLRETVQTLLGTRGDKLDRALTLRDMIESKLFELRPGAVVGPGVAPLQPGAAWPDNTPPPYVPDLTPPPSPDSLTATPAISHVLIEVPPGTYLQGHGHLRTRIYGANPTPSNPSPTFSDAVEVGQFEGTVWAMASDPAVTWRLWAKWESRDNELSSSPAGGTNGVVATTAQDPARLVAALTGPGKPFSVVTVPYTLEDGTPVPAGTYTSQAFMGSFVAQRGQIALLAVDDARIANLSVAKLTAGSVSVGEYAQSTGYVAGSAGWRINGDGTAEFSGVVVRGTIFASQGAIGGWTIGSNYLQSTTYALGTSGTRLNSDGTGQIGGVTVMSDALQSTNFVAGSAGWRLRGDGAVEANSGTFRGDVKGGRFMVGDYQGYAWPASGGGAYLGSEGLLMGRWQAGTNSPHVQITSAGNFYTNGFRVENGVMTIDQANVVNTLNIANQAVTVPATSAASSQWNIGGAATVLGVTINPQGGSAVLIYDLYVVANYTGTGGDNGFYSPVTVNVRRGATVLRSYYVGAGGSQIAGSWSESGINGDQYYNIEFISANGSVFARTLTVIGAKR